MDSIKRKYIKWILGLDITTPNYILKEETKTEEIRTEAMKRAIKYEEKVRNGEKKIVAECIRDLDRERARSEESKWEAARSKLFRGTGLEKRDIKRVREAGDEELIKIIVERNENREREERRKKIAESRYNRTYKDILTRNLPKYLSERRKRKGRSLIARYRCGNECRGNQHWKDDGDKVCRLCEEEVESLEHMIRRCKVTRNDMQIGELLNEDGRGLETMKRIEVARSKRKEREEEEGRKNEETK